MSLFKSIFGGGKGKDKAPTPQEAIQRLRETEEMLQKKSDFLENKVQAELNTAKKHGTKNKRSKSQQGPSICHYLIFISFFEFDPTLRLIFNITRTRLSYSSTTTSFISIPRQNAIHRSMPMGMIHTHSVTDFFEGLNR